MRVSRRAFQAEGAESVGGEREDGTSKNWAVLGRTGGGGSGKESWEG